MKIIRKKSLSEAMHEASKYALQGRMVKIKNIKGVYNVYAYARTQSNKRS